MACKRSAVRSRLAPPNNHKTSYSIKQCLEKDALFDSPIPIKAFALSEREPTGCQSHESFLIKLRASSEIQVL